MIWDVSRYDDTSVSIVDEEVNMASPTVFDVPSFGPLRFPHLKAGLWINSLAGQIIRWESQRLNLHSNRAQRRYFFSFANSLKTFTDRIEREGTLQAVDFQEQTIPSSSIPSWEQRLEQFRQLPKGWDSYGASQIRNEAIDKAKTIFSVIAINGFTSYAFSAPSPNGGIQVELDSTINELVLEIPPTGDPVTFLLVDKTPTGDEEESEGTIEDIRHLQQVLSQVGG